MFRSSSSEVSMAFRGTDQFHFILTSDGSQDMYPDNKTSNFKVQLNEPIHTRDDESWEVGLTSINYPYSWINVGPAAKVYMRYYLPGHQGSVLVDFPNWQCNSLEEIIKFMNHKITAAQKGVKSSSNILAGLDQLGRFKITSTYPNFDMGMSPNMLKLVGMNGPKQAALFNIEAFERRQFLRDCLEGLFEGTAWLTDDMKARIRKTNDLEGVVNLIKDRVKNSQHIVECLLNKSSYFEHTIHDWRGKVADSSSPNLMYMLGINMATDLFWQNLEDVIYCMKRISEFPQIPNTLKGVMPGILNPAQRMYVYTNIIEPYDMNAEKVRLLRLVNTRGESFKTTQEDFINTTYFPLERGKLSMIQVLIADENGEPVPFQSGTVVLTLHFRRKRISV